MSVQPGLWSSHDPRVGQKMTTFQLFFQSGQARDWTAPLYVTLVMNKPSLLPVPTRHHFCLWCHENDVNYNCEPSNFRQVNGMAFWRAMSTTYKPVVLIIGQLNIVFDPDNSRWWVCFNMTLQIHVILQCLSKPWPWSRYHWCKLDFNSDVPSITFAHPIFSYAVVRSPVLFVNPCYLQNIPSGNQQEYKQTTTYHNPRYYNLNTNNQHFRVEPIKINFLLQTFLQFYKFWFDIQK